MSDTFTLAQVAANATARQRAAAGRKAIAVRWTGSAARSEDVTMLRARGERMVAEGLGLMTQAAALEASLTTTTARSPGT